MPSADANLGFSASASVSVSVTDPAPATAPEAGAAAVAVRRHRPRFFRFGVRFGFGHRSGSRHGPRGRSGSGCRPPTPTSVFPLRRPFRFRSPIRIPSPPPRPERQRLPSADADVGFSASASVSVSVTDPAPATAPEAGAAAVAVRRRRRRFFRFGVRFGFGHRSGSRHGPRGRSGSGCRPPTPTSVFPLRRPFRFRSPIRLPPRPPRPERQRLPSADADLRFSASASASVSVTDPAPATAPDFPSLNPDSAVEHSLGRGLVMKTLKACFIALCLIAISARHAAGETFREIQSLEIGPRSRSPIADFNVNRFESQKAPSAAPDCAALGANPRVCQPGMTFVCSRYFRTALCLDTELLPDARTGRPRGNMNLADCQAACAFQGKRLPTNNEWQVGCTGTRPEACLVYSGPHPGVRFSAVPGHPCQVYGPYSGQCMVSQDLVDLLPPTPAACVSEAGVNACVGTFEQWASQHFVAGKSFRFNGGMFALSASAVDYVTPAHGNDFRHYASGCRCASDPGR